MPLSPSLAGLLEPGVFVGSGESFGEEFFVYWRGVVRAVTVTARAHRAGNGGVGLSVRQQVTIERHFEDGIDDEVIIIDGGGDDE